VRVLDGGLELLEALAPRVLFGIELCQRRERV
jgi:hypothetical protein